MIENIGIRHSPLTDSIYLCRFGKDKGLALEKRDCEGDLMEAITAHMMHKAEKGSIKKYKLGNQWYELTVRKMDAE